MKATRRSLLTYFIAASAAMPSLVSAKDLENGSVEAYARVGIAAAAGGTTLGAAVKAFYAQEAKWDLVMKGHKVVSSGSLHGGHLQQASLEALPGDRIVITQTLDNGIDREVRYKMASDAVQNDAVELQKLMAERSELESLMAKKLSDYKISAQQMQGAGFRSSAANAVIQNEMKAADQAFSDLSARYAETTSRIEDRLKPRISRNSAALRMVGENDLGPIRIESEIIVPNASMTMSDKTGVYETTYQAIKKRVVWDQPVEITRYGSIKKQLGQLSRKSRGSIAVALLAAGVLVEEGIAGKVSETIADQAKSVWSPQPKSRGSAQ